jgi:hydroxymethylpyrimidine/phosphomethylpyrimidine kinase
MVGRDRRARRKHAASKKNAQPASARGLRRGRRSTPKVFASKAPNAQGATRAVPVALSIAGSDSSAGAGIQADLKTFSALGIYGLTAVTCVVAETPGNVSRIEPMNAQIVRKQIELLLANFPVSAIKTGLLCTGEIVSAVAEVLRGRGTDIVSANRTDSSGDESVGQAGVRPATSAGSKPVRATAGRTMPRHQAIPLIVDPVMIATSGDVLLRPDAVELYEKELFPLATLITPNLDEASKLLGEQIHNRQTMERAARALGQKYGVSVLLKGGHLAGNRAIDLLFHDGRIEEFAAPFVRDITTHGTGCTYSAAITAGLASGFSLEDSIKHAKKFVTAAIKRHLEWTSQSGGKIHALNHSI